MGFFAEIKCEQILYLIKHSSCKGTSSSVDKKNAILCCTHQDDKAKRKLDFSKAFISTAICSFHLFFHGLCMVHSMLMEVFYMALFFSGFKGASVFPQECLQASSLIVLHCLFSFFLFSSTSSFSLDSSSHCASSSRPSTLHINHMAGRINRSICNSFAASLKDRQRSASIAANAQIPCVCVCINSNR